MKAAYHSRVGTSSVDKNLRVMCPLFHCRVTRLWRPQLQILRLHFLLQKQDPNAGNSRVADCHQQCLSECGCELV